MQKCVQQGSTLGTRRRFYSLINPVIVYLLSSEFPLYIIIIAIIIFIAINRYCVYLLPSGYSSYITIITITIIIIFVIVIIITIIIINAVIIIISIKTSLSNHAYVSVDLSLRIQFYL